MPSTDLLNPVTPVLGGAALSSANAIPVNVISGGGSGITVDSTAITGGTTTRLLYDNGATVGETAGVTFSSATGIAGFGSGIVVSGGAFSSATGGGFLYKDANQGLSLVATPGVINDFALFTPNGNAFVFTVPTGTSVLGIPSIGVLGFLSSAGAADIGLSRVAAASLAVGTGAQGNIAGTILSSSAVLTGTLRYGGVTLASTVTGTGSMVLGTGPSFSSASTVTFTAGGTITYGGVTLSSTVTGTGSMVLSASPSITGTAALAATSHSGLATFSSQVTVTGAATSLFAVGANGATGPAFVVDASQASQASGVKITGSVATNFPTIATVSTSSAGVGLVIDAKGTGSITLANSSTGGITLSTATTLSNTLTYGGVTLSSTVTGTGSMVLSAAPSLTGNVTLVSAAATGILTAQNGVAASATGANFGFQMSSTASFGVIWGALGSVAPTIAATQGCLYINTSGSSTATRMYIKASAAGTWTNFTTAA